MDKKIFLFDKEVYNEGTMIYAIRGDILSAYQDYVDSIKALDAKLNTSADGWKFARKGKKSK